MAHIEIPDEKLELRLTHSAKQILNAAAAAVHVSGPGGQIDTERLNDNSVP
jgi:hypothetical protein